MAAYPSANRKRSRLEEQVEEENPKRFFDLNTTFSPIVEPAEKNLPAITYASPDYRPPPPAQTPLWLQPMHTTHSPMTEDDSEDELLTPSIQQQEQQQSTKKPSIEYWGNMMVDQWQ